MSDSTHGHLLTVGRGVAVLAALQAAMATPSADGTCQYCNTGMGYLQAEVGQCILHPTAGFRVCTSNGWEDAEGCNPYTDFCAACKYEPEICPS